MIKLKPEINDPIYYVHIVILVFVLLIILKYAFNHDIFNMFWQIGIAIIIGDIVAHTLLRLD